jgi:hypothetical protein
MHALQCAKLSNLKGQNNEAIQQTHHNPPLADLPARYRRFFPRSELTKAKTPRKSFMFPFLTGDLIVLLVLVRIYFRKKDGEPAPANASPLLNKLATATHGLLNISLIAVAISGMVTVAASGVVEALKKNDPSLVPDFLL